MQNSNDDTSAKLVPLPEPDTPTAAPCYRFTTTYILHEKQKVIPIKISDDTSETLIVAPDSKTSTITSEESLARIIAPPERKMPIIAPDESPEN